MNKFNDPHGDEPTETTREWNRQPPEAYFKSITSTPQTSPLFLNIMGRLNNYAINNGDVEVYSSNYQFEAISDSVPYMDTTKIKLIDDNEIYQLLEFLHSEHDGYLLDV